MKSIYSQVKKRGIIKKFEDAMLILILEEVNSRNYY